MIKAGLRLTGFLLLAAGFVATVMDAARTLAGSVLDYARLGELAQRLLGERFLLIQTALERQLHPFLWDPLLVTLLQVPTSLVLLLLGLLCHRLGRPAPLRIGYVTRN